MQGECAAVCAVAALLVAAPPAGAVNPAVNEYSLNFPNAKGKSYPGTETPTARPAELAPIVRKALGHSPNGTALAAVATASELGAPDAGSGGKRGTRGSGENVSGETPSMLSAVFGELDDPLVLLGMLAVLGVIAFLWFVAQPRPAGTEP
jgi:hypothetical protein